VVIINNRNLNWQWSCGIVCVVLCICAVKLKEMRRKSQSCDFPCSTSSIDTSSGKKGLVRYSLFHTRYSFNNFAANLEELPRPLLCSAQLMCYYWLYSSHSVRETQPYIGTAAGIMLVSGQKHVLTGDSSQGKIIQASNTFSYCSDCSCCVFVLYSVTVLE